MSFREANLGKVLTNFANVKDGRFSLSPFPASEHKRAEFCKSLDCKTAVFLRLVEMRGLVMRKVWSEGGDVE